MILVRCAETQRAKSRVNASAVGEVCFRRFMASPGARNPTRKEMGRPGKQDLSPTYSVCPRYFHRNLFALEFKLQGELHYAGLCGTPHGGVDVPEGSGRGNVLHETEVPVPTQIEVRMIEQVEELSPELQAHAFAERQNEVLDEREIGVQEVWTVGWGSRRCPELSRWSGLEGAGIEPMLQSVNFCRATRLSPHISALVRVPDQVGALEGVAAVPNKVYAGGVGAIHHEERKSRNVPLNQVHRPIA